MKRTHDYDGWVVSVKQYLNTSESWTSGTPILDSPGDPIPFGAWIGFSSPSTFSSLNIQYRLAPEKAWTSVTTSAGCLQPNANRDYVPGSPTNQYESFGCYYSLGQVKLGDHSKVDIRGIGPRGFTDTKQLRILTPPSAPTNLQVNPTGSHAKPALHITISRTSGSISAYKYSIDGGQSWSGNPTQLWKDNKLVFDARKLALRTDFTIRGNQWLADGYRTPWVAIQPSTQYQVLVAACTAWNVASILNDYVCVPSDSVSVTTL